MIDSHVIEVAGTFAGAAVSTAEGFRFVAVDPRVRELNGRQWRTLRDVRRAAGCLMNGPAARTPSAESSQCLPRGGFE